MGKPPDERTPKADIVAEAQGDGWRVLLLVPADRLTASVQMVKSSPRAVCPVEKVVELVVELVRGSKVRLSRDEEARLPELARTLKGDGKLVVVAKGTPAEAWKEIDWLIPMGISSLRDYSHETVDLHEVRQFINVRAGQVLCELPPAPKDGCNVLGQSIPAPPCPFQLGEHAAIDPHNPSRVVAVEPGCVRFVGGRLSVEQRLEIPGDLDFKTGNIDFFGDVTVRGNVLDGFHIKSAKNIVIDGAVGAATLEAAGTLTIKGGVNGSHKGRLVSGGNLQAHYLHMVSVECGGDVLVDIECHDSTVLAAGRVSVSRGGIVGGKVLAGSDVSAGFVGAEMCVPTTVHAGYQAGLDAQVEKTRAGLARTLALVKNLESALARCVEQPGVSSRFPSQRKTQTIQFQSRLHDARVVAKRSLAELSAQMGRATLAGASIASAKQVFPKVTLVLDSICEEEVVDELAGPIRLSLDREHLAIKAVASKRSQKN
jgi:uncharacterized protein (DUF342 family)